MSWLIWLRVVAVTVLLIPFVQLSTRFWAERSQLGGRHLRVLETCSLGPDGRLYLVEVGGKVYALASVAKGLQVIDEVTAPEVLSDLRRGEGVRAEVPSLVAPLANLVSQGAAVLRRTLGRDTAGGRRAQDEAGRRAVELLAAQLHRVRRMGMGDAGDEVFAVSKR